QKAYETLGYKAGDFPVTERVADEIVSLPMYPQLKAGQQARVAGEVQEFLAQQMSTPESELESAGRKA
ncbi:MAG: DegT/DnrJ/EryC1/StrS family aminotransferase, partial [Terriglobales bacterium]